MSILFGFKMLGLAELRKSLDGASARLDDELFKRMQALVLEIAGGAQRYIVGTRVSNPPELLAIRTGRLRASITGKAVRVGKSAVEGVIAPQRVRYAAIHELGGTITAKSGPYLKFKTDSGNWVQVRSVTIPARPYLGRALADWKDRITERLGSGLAASVILK